MENFTPVSGFIGGVLIGCGAVMLMALNGRIAGVSGILGGAFAGSRGDVGWRLAFLAGLIAAPLVYSAVTGANAVVVFPAAIPVMAIGGLLVGVGTRLGGGCTSGHGVCGMARLSPRSIVATLVFMGFGILTVTLVRHILGG